MSHNFDVTRAAPQFSIAQLCEDEPSAASAAPVSEIPQSVHVHQNLLQRLRAFQEFEQASKFMKEFKARTIQDISSNDHSALGELTVLKKIISAFQNIYKENARCEFLGTQVAGAMLPITRSMQQTEEAVKELSKRVETLEKELEDKSAIKKHAELLEKKLKAKSTIEKHAELLERRLESKCEIEKLLREKIEVLSKELNAAKKGHRISEEDLVKFTLFDSKVAQVSREIQEIKQFVAEAPLGRSKRGYDGSGKTSACKETKMDDETQQVLIIASKARAAASPRKRGHDNTGPTGGDKRTQLDQQDMDIGDGVITNAASGAFSPVDF